MSNRTVNNRVNVLPELGGSRSVQETQTAQVNAALNTALNRKLPPFPALQAVNCDALSAPDHTYTVQQQDRTLALVGSLSSAIIQFPSARLNSGRQLHLLFRATPFAPTVTASPTGGTVPIGTYYVALSYLLTGGGETLPSLPSLVQALAATSVVTVRSPGGQTLSGVSGYQVYVGLARTGPFYLQTGSGTAIGTDSVFTAPFATSGSVPPTSNPHSATPALLPWGGDHLEALPSNAISATYQSAGDTGVWHLVASTSTPPAPSGVTSLNSLGGALSLLNGGGIAIAASGSDITLTPQPGFRWPTAGQNLTVNQDDTTIYGTAGQHAGTVTLPLAASMPGKIVLFSYPPGSVIGSGSDTVDAYAHSSAIFQSDGVSSWRVILSV